MGGSALSADALAGGEAASLSLNHNCIAPGVADDSDGQQPLPFQLTGSQKKTAFALEQNVAAMIEEAGLENCGFLTLTVGDLITCSEAGCAGCGKEHFRQVWEAPESSRRIHSLMTNLLDELFPRAVIVTERHKSGAIHFHLIVECLGDIRTGFDFEAFLDARNARKAGYVDHEAEKRYADSATPVLKRLWSILRERLPSYGFGRAELTPIYKTGEAVSRYVSKYVEKNLFNRRPEDKGKKLVRYMGWRGSQMTANKFSWCNPRATAWRNKARDLAALALVTSREKVAAAFGARWSFKLTRVMHAVDDRPLPAFEWTYPERECARQLVCRVARRQWLNKAETENQAVPVEWRIAA